MPLEPPPAAPFATAGRDLSCAPAMSTRWPRRSGACTTIRACADGLPMQGRVRWRRTRTRHGLPASQRRFRAGMPASVKTAPLAGDTPLRLPMRRLLAATFLLLLLVPAAAALAGDNAQDLLIDACRDENVNGTYSQRTYTQALDQLPADSDQYTACRDVINRARLAALNNRHVSSGGGNSGGGNHTGVAPRATRGGGGGGG